jgi:hypothetical protein
LTTLPLSKLQNAIFRLEGVRLTQKQFAEQWGAPVAHVDAVPGLGGELWTWLQSQYEQGHGSTRWSPALGREIAEDGPEIARNVWEGHTWKTVADVKKNPVIKV